MNKDIIESFKTYLITEKYLVDNSVESYYLDIKCYLEYLDKDYKNITREDIKDYLKYLNDSNYSKSSTDRKISSIKTFHHYLYRYYSIEDISKNIISKMTKEEVYEASYKWASKYSESLKEMIDKDVEYYKNILNIERQQAKPRKDIAKYSDIENLIWYMYDDIFYNKEKEYEWKNITDKEEINNILDVYMSKYIELGDKETWFNNIKLMCDELGYASNMKEYKKNPENFKGNVADVSTVLRVALTSKSMTPDLYEIMNLMGIDRIKERYNKINEEI